MANQPVYLIAVIFASVSLFLVWLSYKFMIPIWSAVVTPITAVYPSMVNNDPTFVAGFNTIASQSFLLINYAFAAVALGIVSVFILIFAYRDVFGSTLTGEEEF